MPSSRKRHAAPPADRAPLRQRPRRRPCHIRGSCFPAFACRWRMTRMAGDLAQALRMISVRFCFVSAGETHGGRRCRRVPRPRTSAPLPWAHSTRRTPPRWCRRSGPRSPLRNPDPLRALSVGGSPETPRLCQSVSRANTIPKNDHALCRFPLRRCGCICANAHACPYCERQHPEPIHWPITEKPCTCIANRR